jgi:hypothetical protein
VVFLVVGSADDLYCLVAVLFVVVDAGLGAESGVPYLSKLGSFCGN